MKDSFWAGGDGAYERAVRDRYQSQAKEVEQQITYCADEQQRSELQAELKKVEVEYREMRGKSGWLIF